MCVCAACQVSKRLSGSCVFFPVLIEREYLVYSFYFFKLTATESMVPVFEPVVYLFFSFCYIHLNHYYMARFALILVHFLTQEKGEMLHFIFVFCYVQKPVDDLAYCNSFAAVLELLL